MLTCALGCGPTAYKITPVPVDRKLKESTVIDEGGFGPAKIVLVDVDGLLMSREKYSLFGEGENPLSLFVEKLDKAARDAGVRGLIVRINSPGGTVTASDLMYAELLHFKQRTEGKRPVVAVLRDDEILLVRYARSATMHTIVAGFVEPGETLEECVQREVFEEVAIEVKNIRYFGSQPWPFPDSLMIGFTAQYAGGRIKVDGKEIAEAGWYATDDLPEIPPPISISRAIIDWYTEGRPNMQ